SLARDCVLPTVMIVLDPSSGLAFIVGGMRHDNLRVTRIGISTYLSLLVVLIATAFAVPAVIGADGSYKTGQAITIITLTIVLYGFLLYRQTGGLQGEYVEVMEAPGAGEGPAPHRPRIGVIRREYKGEILSRAVVLLITVIPIVLLSHDMASLLDDGLTRIGAPLALSGVIIAMIVFLPEAITTVRAAWQGEAQRVTNLAHGALVSCVGLTLPVVLAIGLVTNQTVILAETPANLVFLVISLLLSIATFTAHRVTAVHGSANLSVFVLYGLSVFA